MKEKDNQNKTLFKERQSNIELCRIISIILILFLHSTFFSLGVDVSYGVMLLAGFSIVGVNVFVMITGYFSATPKKSSLINLLFICFYWMIVKIAINIGFQQGVDLNDILFISNSNWFIPAYIVLLFITPILNVFSQTVSKRALLGGVFSLLILEIWFDWIPPHLEKVGFIQGYSALHFIVLYLIARYIKLFDLPNWFKKVSFAIYLTCSFITATLFYAKSRWMPLSVNYYAYNSPLVMMASISLLVTFLQLKLATSKIINHLAKSTLAVLLGHFLIMFLYQAQFKYIYSHFSGIKLITFWVISVITVFSVLVVVDQIRILLFHPLRQYIKRTISDDSLFKE